MAIRILSKEKNEIEIDLGDDVDQSIAHLLVEKLNEVKSVEFAAYRIQHPVIGTPHLIIKTKDGDPMELLTKKINEIREEVNEFKKQFSEISK